MQLGMIGLGRMGAHMVRRLIRGGHDRIVFDASPRTVADLEKNKATNASSLPDLIGKLQKPRALWLMVLATRQRNCLLVARPDRCRSAGRSGTLEVRRAPGEDGEVEGTR